MAEKSGVEQGIKDFLESSYFQGKLIKHTRKTSSEVCEEFLARQKEIIQEHISQEFSKRGFDNDYQKCQANNIYTTKARIGSEEALKLLKKGAIGLFIGGIVFILGEGIIEALSNIFHRK